MLFFDKRGILVPEEQRHEVPIVLWLVTPPRKDLDHVFFAVEGFPRLLVGACPFLGRHTRMFDGGVKRVAFIEIRVHPLAAFSHFAMIVGTRQRRQHEERGLIGSDFVHQKPDVFGHLLFGIPRQADDVARVHDHPGVVPLLDNLAILVNIVLLFAFGLQVFRVDTFHSDEDLSTAGFGRQLNEVLRLAGQIDLHHERDVEAFLPKFDDRFERLAPEFFPGKIIVGEEIERKYRAPNNSCAGEPQCFPGSVRASSVPAH